jgi:hypothetical protein
MKAGRDALAVRSRRNAWAPKTITTYGYILQPKAIVLLRPDLSPKNWFGWSID